MRFTHLPQRIAAALLIGLLSTAGLALGAEAEETDDQPTPEIMAAPADTTIWHDVWSLFEGLWGGGGDPPEADSQTSSDGDPAAGPEVDPAG